MRKTVIQLSLSILMWMMGTPPSEISGKQFSIHAQVNHRLNTPTVTLTNVTCNPCTGNASNPTGISTNWTVQMPLQKPGQPPTATIGKFRLKVKMTGSCTALAEAEFPASARTGVLKLPACPRADGGTYEMTITTLFTNPPSTEVKTTSTTKIGLIPQIP